MDCPNRKVITLTEWEVVNEEEIEEEKGVCLAEEEKENQEEVEEQVNEAEKFVQRTLSNKKVKRKNEEKTFFTLDTFQGKICFMIIDGGSCTNIVSLSIIEKLNFNASVHSHLHNI